MNYDSAQEFNEKKLEGYEPVGIMFDVYIRSLEGGYPPRTLYLPNYSHTGELIWDLEPIFYIDRPVLGHYPVQASTKWGVFGERKILRRNCTYDTVIYKRKPK